MNYLQTKNLSYDSFFPLTHPQNNNEREEDSSKRKIQYTQSSSNQQHISSKSLDYFSIKPKLSLDIHNLSTSPNYLSDAENIHDFSDSESLHSRDDLIEPFEQAIITNDDYSPLTPFEEDHKPNQAQQKESKDSSDAPSSTTNMQLILPNLYPYRFLIVDDNLINLKILNKVLLKIYPKATIVQLQDSTKVEKLLFEQNLKFDSIFIDIEMPIIDGIKIANLVRTSEKFDKIGLIAVTTRNSENDLKLFKANGIDYTFNKPLNFKLDFMGSIIDEIIENRKNAL
ncbi:unnamed protein product [Candida verbasci]|uniref:Response regulatory domain-containing protein n=1 Tax=Candida verbasci TaxID=1227364 RepID=A0A9W4X842_9ASCO|nr:unnamed protein product [Candida verbasci]